MDARNRRAFQELLGVLGQYGGNVAMVDYANEEEWRRHSHVVPSQYRTYAAYVRGRDATVADYRRRGINVQLDIVPFGEMVQWCQEKGIPVTNESRKLFSATGARNGRKNMILARDEETADKCNSFINMIKPAFPQRSGK